MSGNVHEWCTDWYGDYSSNAQTNPTGPLTSPFRVLRGGDWFNYATACRVSSRRIGMPDDGEFHGGLRLVL